jgi:UTP--glucose-1-phosphate uridylyltransferase
MSDDSRTAAADKMRADGQHEEAVGAFLSAYDRLVGGDEALITSDSLEPAGEVAVLDDLPAVEERRLGEVLGEVALIKLNGGLATSMGLQQPKSLMEARDGRTFLDIIVGQTIALRERHDVALPLVLMDSESTRAATLQALRAYDDLPVDGLTPDFMQSMIPKLDADTLAPVSWPQRPALEWCPPGHGDVYGALRRSGMLDALRERGIRYAMISNSDNLGAQLDARVPAHMSEHELPFLMEVVRGTEADRKGGHLARRRSDGRLILRESAQTPPEDADSFRDYRRWQYYNTNNLWVDLDALHRTLEQSGGVLELPLIINRKTVDPRDSDSTPVIQLESAMGAAIGAFEGAELLLVPRTRFAPVKTTDDLLVLRSDVYTVTAEMAVEPIPERAADMPYVELDPRFYKIIDGFEARFPAGPPSLRKAERLIVKGDVTFERGVVVRGAVALDGDEPRTIAAGTVLEDAE